MIEAGSETTSSLLNSAIKYLARYPEVQARANYEVSVAIGDHRSPTFEDEEQLPYIRAMVKEVLRIRPVAAVGSPHFTTEDLVYKDMFIPKGTVVTINQWALHFTEERYQDPLAFRPERYLNHPLKAGAYTGLADPYARDHFAFGAGRRVCPGLHLAENSLFITLAKIAWAFEIKPAVNEHGMEIPVDVSDTAYDEGVNTLPNPYKIRFKPRNATREKVLQEEWKTAKRAGYFLGEVKVNAEGMVIA
jgi:cytochrome P450